MASPDVFRLSPFREMGQALGVIRRFGGAEPLRTTLGEMQHRLYRKGDPMSREQLTNDIWACLRHYAP